MSSIGTGRRSCRRTKSAPIPRPIARGRIESTVIPSCATALMPYTTGSMVASESTMLVTSIRPGCGSRDSGTNRGASTSSGTRSGTASRKTDPQAKFSSRIPPTTGPSALPAANPVAQMAMARRRWSLSRKMERSSDSVDGMSMAPKKPRAARATISHSIVGENAAPIETRPNPAEPTRSRRRRPIRSPRLPIVTSKPARTSG